MYSTCTVNVILQVAALLCLANLYSTEVEELYRNISCTSKVCKPSNYSSPHELQWMNSLMIIAKGDVMEDFQSSLSASVTSRGTYSYVNQAISSHGDSGIYFHSNSGLWITQFPLLGHGFLHSVSLNISHGGVINIYSMSLYDDCKRFNMFWRCLNNSLTLDLDWGEEVSNALDEIEYYSSGLLEDTFYVVNSLELVLLETGDKDFVLDLLVLKDNYIGFESIDATIICNLFDQMNTISFTSYEFATQSNLSPYFRMDFEYKTYQPYELSFPDFPPLPHSNESLDFSVNFVLNVENGTLTTVRPLQGYFSSYSLIFTIPHWNALFNNLDEISFSPLAIINGYLIGMPNTTRELNYLINMPPPADIALSNSVVTHPNKSFSAALQGQNTDIDIIDSIENFRWTLSVLPSNTPIKFSTEENFNYGDLIMPGKYRLLVEFDTSDNITFKTFSDIEYISEDFTFIKCSLNCDPSFTTGYVNLHLSVDVATLLKLNFDVVSAKWSVIEQDTKDDITMNVTMFDDTIEISIDTSILTRKRYVVNLVVVTFERNITVHDEYRFNMSYPQYSLDCDVIPYAGISLKTKHDISCALRIDNIICSLCEGSESMLCGLCLLDYTYFFRFCLDHGDCSIQSPLTLGNLSKPEVDDILLPIGNENHGFNLTAVACMYDRNGQVEYVHELFYVVSKPDPRVNISNIITDASSAMGSTNKTEIFYHVQQVGIALSHIQVNETTQRQVVDLLKKVKLQHVDISMAIFSVLYPLSQMKVYDGSTEELTYITNTTYESIQGAQDDVVKSASNAMLSVMWNVVESNAEISEVQDDLPEFSFNFATESPDKQYYNKWVDFDIEEESQSINNSVRSSDICATLQTLQEYAGQFLKEGASLGEVSTLELPNILYSLGRVTASMLQSGTQLVGKSFVKLPFLRFNNVSFVDTLLITFVKFKSNPCILTTNSDRIKSAVIGINITDSSRRRVVVDKFDKPIDVLVPLKGRQSLQEFLYNPDYNWLYLQLDILAKPQSVLFFDLLATRAMTVLIKYLQLPKILDHDFKFEIPNMAGNKLKEQKLHELGFSPNQNYSVETFQVPIRTNGTYFIGLRMVGIKARRFWLLPYMTSCLKWTGDGWSISSEYVGNLSNSTVTHCKFQDISLYAADLSYPNLTEFKQPLPQEELLSRVLDSLKIWIPLIVLYGYLLSTFTFVIRLHDRDLRSTNLLHLLSSNKTQFSYKIDIKTGIRPKAGTTSQVFLELHGSLATRRIKIAQKCGELFETNQTSSFVFYSDVNLGRLDKVHVWIDYSGKYPDWFLESLRITNSSGRVFTFLYNNWIGYDIERYTCSIPRFRPSEVSLVKRLYTSLCESLVNYHSGLSYLLKNTRIFPPRIYLNSLFVLRCLTLLCLVVIVFGDSVQDHVSSADFLKMLFLLLSTYPGFFLLEKGQEILNKNERHNFLVRKRLNRQDSESSVFTLDLDKYFWVTAQDRSVKQKCAKEMSPVHDELDKYFELTTKDSTTRPAEKQHIKDYEPLRQTEIETLFEDDTDSLCKKTVKVDDYFGFFWDTSSSISSVGKTASLNFEMETKPGVLPEPTLKFYSNLLRKMLDITSYIGILTTTCFYLFYTYNSQSIHMNTCLMYYGGVIFLFLFAEQPLACGVIMLVYSHRLWYGVYNHDSHCHTLLNAGEADGNLTKHPEIKTWYGTMNKRRKMNTVIVKLFSYIAFIIIVVILSKHDRQTNCYYLNRSVQKIFATPAFDSIETKADFWKWIQDDYSLTLSSKDFFAGTKAKIPKENYLRDGSSIIISISRLRQVRIKPTPCLTQKNEFCNVGYRSSIIENRNFDPTWRDFTPAPADAWFSIIRYKSYWQYHEGDDGVTFRGQAGLYSAGGYKVPLANSPVNAQKQLAMLERDGWIDRFTRAVFVELSVYNPPTGFLCTVKLITEFLPTGGAISYSRLHSINFLKYSKSISLSSIKTELVYLTSLIILSAYYIRNLYLAHSKGHSVWRGFWTLLDTVTLLVGWTSVGMYVYRYKYIHTAIAQFQATPYYYIDFHRAAEVDIYFGYCLGALVFLVTVKIVDLTIAHVKIKLMTLVIHNSLVELSSFGVPFFILLAVFSQTFFCLYSSSMLEFSHIQSSFGQTFAFILGEYNWDGMMRVRPYLTPFLGLLLGLLSITYLANMFAVIVCYNTTSIRLKPPTTGHLAIFGYLTETLKNVLFLIVPLLDDLYSLFKRNLPGRNENLRNALYRKVEENNSNAGSLSSKHPALPGTSSVLQIPPKDKDVKLQNAPNNNSLAEMRSKLKSQSKTLKILKNRLSALESRLQKLQ